MEMSQTHNRGRHEQRLPIALAQGPLTPMGGWTGVLVGEIPGQKSFLNLDQVAIWTPQMYGLSTPLGEAVLMAI